MTTKQKLVASKLMENGGNVSKTMLAVGYSPATAKNPKKLTRSKGWQELMEHYFPNEGILLEQKKLLKAVQIHCLDFPLSVGDKIIRRLIERTSGFKLLQILEGKDKKLAYYLKPDYLIRGKTLDTIYKLKGKYTAIKLEHNVNPELEAFLDKVRDRLPKAQPN